MDMYPTLKKSSKSNSNFSINRMQRSRFSNTVYKNNFTGEIRVTQRPTSEAETGQLCFNTQTFQSILMVQKLLRADSIIAHIKEKKKRNVRLSTRHSQCWILLRFTCFPNIQMAAPSCSSVQLCLTDVRKMSNLSRCLLPR